MGWDTPAGQDSLDRAIAALNEHGMNASLVQTGKEAREKVLSIIPPGEEVMNMTSMTLSAIGLDKDIMESGRYQATKNALSKMDPKTQHLEMQRLGAAPPWAIGSVHAVTEDGSAMLASKTGSQMAAYVYGALKVIWVVGAQKVVADRDEGIRRIYEWSLPHERERALKAYGPGTTTAVNKLLIFNGEKTKDRITLILVNEVLGF
ncbi:MAG TPA: LUD domain-containing protein [Candidatus Anoxymicrobiaceae bacterium]